MVLITCFNKKQVKKRGLELLQKDFVNCIFFEEDERLTELRMKCGKILKYRSEKTKELYVMTEK